MNEEKAQVLHRKVASFLSLFAIIGVVVGVFYLGAHERYDLVHVPYGYSNDMAEKDVAFIVGLYGYFLSGSENDNNIEHLVNSEGFRQLQAEFMSYPEDHKNYLWDFFYSYMEYEKFYVKTTGDLFSLRRFGELNDSMVIGLRENLFADYNFDALKRVFYEQDERASRTLSYLNSLEQEQRAPVGLGLVIEMRRLSDDAKSHSEDILTILLGVRAQ